ncbi:hypothetical protein M426DRAFT_192074 [Hypoxylon sp. CI-4A]|nr:hypothetical protein M426DRAFT_192074 [Hypoxylon sp. CI-4A]
MLAWFSFRNRHLFRMTLPPITHAMKSSNNPKVIHEGERETERQRSFFKVISKKRKKDQNRSKAHLDSQEFRPPLYHTFLFLFLLLLLQPPMCYCPSICCIKTHPNNKVKNKKEKKSNMID